MADKLSPEELKELEELRAMEAQESQSAEMSPEEMAELEELRALEARSQDITPGESFVEGVKSGTTLGFSDEIGGAVQAAADMVLGGVSDVDKKLAEQGFTGDLTPTTAELYEKATKENRDDIAAHEAANPYSFIAGDVSGGVLTGVATGGVTSGMSGAIKMGAVAGLGHSNAESVGEAAMGITTGGVLGAVGQKVGTKIAEKGAKAFGSLKDKARRLKTGTVLETLGVNSKPKATAVHRKLNGVGRNADEFTDEIMDMTIKSPNLSTGEMTETPLIKMGQSFKETYDNTIVGLQQNGAEIGMFIDNAEKLAQQAGRADLVHMSGEDLASLIKQTVIDSDEYMLEGGGKAIAKEVQTWVDASFLPGKQYSLKDIQRLRGAVTRFKIQKFDPTATEKNNAYRKVLATLTDTIEEGVGMSLDEEGKMAFKMAKRRFHNLSIAQNMVEDSAATELSGVMGKLRNALQFRGAMLMGAIGGAPGAVVGLVTNNMLNSTTLPASAAVPLNKMSRAMNNNPGKYAPIATRIVESAFRSQGAFNQALAVGTSLVALNESPVQRTTADVILKFDHIYNLVKDENVEIANQLKEAVANNDSAKIAQLMHSISQIPAAKPYIQQGQGWDGQVQTPEEEEAVATQIKEQYKGDLQTQANLTEQLRKTKKIPDFNSVEPSDQFMKIYSPRLKRDIRIT
jgi:hypothetical protein